MLVFHPNNCIKAVNEPSGKIVLSDQIQPAAYARIGVTGREKIQKELSHGNKTFLQIHQQQFEQEKFT
jgi:hypothetical protein